MPIVEQGGIVASTTSSQGVAVDSLISRFARECGDFPPDGKLALNWLEDRYRQVWSASDWPFAIKFGVFQTVAKITAGTVTVTNNSATVSETTTNDNGWSSSVEGRFFRATGDNTFYEIPTFTNGTPDTITLQRVYEGSTATEKGYTIFQHVYSLGSDVGRIENLVDLNQGQPLREVNQNHLDMVFPNRPSYGEPQLWANSGRDENDIYQVELYYIPSSVRSFQYRYIQEAPYLTSGDQKTVPHAFESMLRHGWKADYWRWRATMNDAKGQEGAWAAQEELLFNKELSEMSAREAQNRPPQKIKMAERYIRHRFKRNNRYRRIWDTE